MYPEDFIVPSVEQTPSIYPERVASDQAFYASGSYSNNPIEDYNRILSDLTQQGKSELFEITKQRWINEQDVSNKRAVESLIQDPNVDNETKKSVLTSYSLGGLLSSDIKDKYVQKVASMDASTNPVDQDSQTEFSKNVVFLQQELDKSIQRQTAEEGRSKFADTATAVGLVGADIVQSIGAGLAGALYSIYEWDAVEGQKLTNRLMEKWRIAPQSVNSEETRTEILDTLSVLGIPAEKLGEFITETTGSANVGLVGGVVLDPVALVSAPVGGAAFSKIKSAINVRRNAPINTTAAANPSVADSLVKGALEDPSDTTAKAIGASKAQLINEGVLPKFYTNTDLRLLPDVSNYFRELDKQWSTEFKQFRFDENVQALAEQRRLDYDMVVDVLSKERNAVYLQNKSSIENIDGNIYEGVAKYGKDSKYFFSDIDEVIDVYTDFKSDIDALPEELSKDIRIVDEVTQKSYTPEELRADPMFAFPQQPKQFSIEFRWKREYDDISKLYFGADSVTSSISLGPGPLKGIDVSSIARSGLNWWMLNPGTLPKWFESGAARTAPRAAKQESLILNNLKRNVGGTKHKKELNDLINLAEQEKRDYFTLGDIRGKYPYLKEKEVQNLFTSYMTWRRFTQYLHSLVNLEQRRKLYKEGFDRGLYVNGIYTNDPVNVNFKFKSRDDADIEVWDATLNIPIKFTWNTSRTDGIYDIGGKQVVQLKNPYRNPETNKIYQYTLIDNVSAKIDVLPERVVPRTPGYSPIKTQENFFIQATPLELTVNGKLITNPNVLEQSYTEVIGAARTKKEAQKLVAKLKAEYPDKNISIKQDRAVNFNTLIDDLESREQLNRNAMQRGEKLNSLYGPARIEDRLTSLVNTTRSLVRQNAFSIWEDAFQDAFVRSYGEFLTNGEFPKSLANLESRPNMSLEKQKLFDEAKTLFSKYSRMKSFGTLSDAYFQKAFHWLADIFDNWRLPADTLRAIGNKGNFVVTAAKTVASTLFINFAPQRQWLVQMQTLLDMAMISPLDAPKIFADTLAVRGALLSQSELTAKGLSGHLQKVFSTVSSMDKKEFDATVEAIKKSGLMESIDLNMMVHGVLNDLNDPMIRSTTSRIVSAPGDAIKATSRTARAVGFDAAEFTNRLGLWLVAKDLWKKNNPGKDWNTTRVIEEISFEEWRLSGSMSRAGALAYQEGLLSMFMQFAAISQKLTMNVFQDNATMLTGSQRARLAAARALMYGPRFGLPIAGLVSKYVNSVEDPELQEQLKSMEKGLLDIAGNALLKAMTGEEANVNFSSSFSPYSDWGLPQIDVYFEMAKLWDGKPTDPRFPALGAISSIEETFNKLQGWFTVGQITTDNWGKAVYEVSKLASGMSNFSKMQVMLATQDKFTKMGSPIGLKATAAEAYAQFFGLPTFREEDLWEAATAWADSKVVIKTMAEDIHKTLVSIYQAFPEDADKQAQYLSSFVSMLEGENWGPAEIDDLVTQVIELDKQRYMTVGDSILMKILDKTAGNNSADLTKARNLLLMYSSSDPNKAEDLKQLIDLLQGKGNP